MGEEKQTVRDLVEVNYKYDTNIYAGLGYSSKWDNNDYLSLPLPANITREGVELRV